jgi:hypothetical protein
MLNAGRIAIEAELGNLHVSDLHQLDGLLNGLDATLERLSTLKPSTMREIGILVDAAAYEVDLIANSVAEDGEARRHRGAILERMLANVRTAFQA